MRNEAAFARLNLSTFFGKFCFSFDDGAKFRFAFRVAQGRSYPQDRLVRRKNRYLLSWVWSNDLVVPQC